MDDIKKGNVMLLDEFSKLHASDKPLKFEEKIENRPCSMCNQIFEYKASFLNGHRAIQNPICPKCSEKIKSFIIDGNIAKR